jgi:hypothetical protein
MSIQKSLAGGREIGSLDCQPLSGPILQRWSNLWFRQNSFSSTFEKGLAITILGHVTIYRYQPKVSLSEVHAISAFGCKVALDYSARHSFGPSDA